MSAQTGANHEIDTKWLIRAAVHTKKLRFGDDATSLDHFQKSVLAHR